MAKNIVSSAERNQVFWEKKDKGQLQWGVEYGESQYDEFFRNVDPLTRYTEIRDMRDRQRASEEAEPRYIEGWVPVTIQKQDIWVRDSSFYTYGHIQATQDSLEIEFYPHDPMMNGMFRRSWILRDVLIDQPTDAEVADPMQSTWTKVILRNQRTWIRYDPSVLKILPEISESTKYLTITLRAMFPSTRIFSGFIHKDSWANIFQKWPSKQPSRGRPEFVRDDEEDYEQSAPVQNVLVSATAADQIIVRGPAERLEDDSIWQIFGVYNSRRGVPYQREYTAVPSQPDPRYGCILWSRIGGVVDSCLTTIFIDLLNNDPNPDKFRLFEEIVESVSSDIVPPADTSWPLTMWMQYSWKDQISRTRFHPVRYLNLTELLDIYQYFGTGVRDYTRFFERVETAGIVWAWAGSVVAEQSVEPPQKPLTLPKRIRNLCVAECIKTDEMCPIAMEPLTEENIAITSCFHYFQKQAIQTWLSTNNKCPQCRENTSLLM